ncbi:MAG: hypothetical protein OEM93_00840 [Rhodospirillales bacterium]|nr:hypothetical protein [Rhodospirillales bacterium]MDH3917853.1 hypothetical protein [Rhodospirillales bacterium]MDH3965944.1 hypothetical protein [Rhodospirillales bacterium]
MEDRFDMAKLLDLRKLTTAIAEILQGQLAEYLSTLHPLFAPQRVLGNNTSPGTSATVKGADKVFAELQAAYIRLAGTKLYNLPKALEPPIPVTTSRPEIVRVEYPYEASADGATKSLTTVAPLKWVLTYGGFTPEHLRALLSQGVNVNERQLTETLLHVLMMDLVVSRQSGLTDILRALGFTVETSHAPEFGELPLTYVSAPVHTRRPPDQLMLQIAEISGSPVFEEVVRIEDIVALKTPLKDQLLEAARSHAGGLLEAAGG